jgi:hypothetical protein
MTYIGFYEEWTSEPCAFINIFDICLRSRGKNLTRKVMPNYEERRCNCKKYFRKSFHTRVAWKPLSASRNQFSLSQRTVHMRQVVEQQTDVFPVIFSSKICRSQVWGELIITIWVTNFNLMNYRRSKSSCHPIYLWIRSSARGTDNRFMYVLGRPFIRAYFPLISSTTEWVNALSKCNTPTYKLSNNPVSIWPRERYRQRSVSWNVQNWMIHQEECNQWRRCPKHSKKLWPWLLMCCSTVASPPRSLHPETSRISDGECKRRIITHYPLTEAPSIALRLAQVDQKELTLLESLLTLDIAESVRSNPAFSLRVPEPHCENIPCRRHGNSGCVSNLTDWRPWIVVKDLQYSDLNQLIWRPPAQILWLIVYWVPTQTPDGSWDHRGWKGKLAQSLNKMLTDCCD